MGEPRVVGMVIYTYAILEERLEELWQWLASVEHWAGQPFAEFAFDSRAKESSRIWKASPKNRAILYQRLQTEQPWAGIDFGWPAGTLRSKPYKTRGMDVFIESRPQPQRGNESYRRPSYVCVEVHTDILRRSISGVSGFIELGIDAWRIISGVYGFIDVETGTPLRDDFLRNAIHLFDTTVPPEYHQEFRAWQRLESDLDKRVWKAFWGNFLSAEHVRQLGGVQNMRHADPLYRLLPEYLEQAYKRGIERLQACHCIYQMYQLANGGVLLTLSKNPLTWSDIEVQRRANLLQNALGQLVLRPSDIDK